MATACKVSSGYRWKKCREVIFHDIHGPNIKISADGHEATRKCAVTFSDDKKIVGQVAEKGFAYGVVFTSKPVPVGYMMEVAVLKNADMFKGGMVLLFRGCSS